MICAIIVPRQEDIVGCRDDYLAACIRESGHRGPHVIMTPEGKYVAWEDDWTCGCCSPEEDDRCYTYWEISEEDFLVLNRPRAET